MSKSGGRTALCRPGKPHSKKSGEGTVEVDVAAVNENMLAGSVAGFFGEQEDDGVGDFFGGGPAVAERNFGFDAGASLLRFGKFREPGLVERGHDFGGKDRVDADIVGEKFDGPFAG